MKYVFLVMIGFAWLWSSCESPSTTVEEPASVEIEKNREAAKGSTKSNLEKELKAISCDKPLEVKTCCMAMIPSCTKCQEKSRALQKAFAEKCR